MASSSRLRNASGDVSKTPCWFRTIISVDKDEIAVCRKFGDKYAIELSNNNGLCWLRTGDNHFCTMNFKKVYDDYVMKPRFSVSVVYKFDKPLHVILYYEGDGKHFTVIILDGQLDPPLFDEGKFGHYSWQKRCSMTFAKGNSCLHFPSQVCNNLPFAENHTIKVVNLETNHTVICPVQESDTLYPQYHLTKPWYAFAKNMQLKENDELCFLLDHPPTKLIVWKI